MKQDNEKRNHTRSHVVWSATVAWKGHGLVGGRILDISAVGAYMETPANLEVNSELIIQILVNKVNASISPLCQVARRVILSEMRGYGYGLKFIQISEADRKIILASLGK